MDEAMQRYLMSIDENIINIAIYQRMQAELKVAAALDSEGLNQKVIGNRIRKELRMNEIDLFGDPKYDTKGKTKSGE